MAPQETVCAQPLEEKTTPEVTQIAPEAEPKAALAVAGNRVVVGNFVETSEADDVVAPSGPVVDQSVEEGQPKMEEQEGCFENPNFQPEGESKPNPRESMKNIHQESEEAASKKSNNLEVVYKSNTVSLGGGNEKGDRNDPQDPDFDQKLIDFDDVLPHMGEFGLYQKILFLLLAPFAFFVAFVYFTQIFITLVPEQHWCRVPELENISLAQRLHLSIPQVDRKDGSFGRVYDKCLMYDVDYAKVVAEGRQEPESTWKTVPCRSGWEFNYTDIPYKTIASELGWVCENASLGSIAQAVFFFGAITGGLIFGWVADRFGRIPALVGTNMIGLIAGCATATVHSFWAFCVCRFLVGIAFDNCFTMMYILVLEYVGPKWRTFVANMSIAIYFTFASCLLPWIAIWVADWRVLCIVTSAPLALAIVTPWIVPESARWLVSQGQLEKALTIMKKFEKINGTKVDPQIYQDFTESCMKVQKEEEADKSYSVLDLFRSPRLRKITILLIIIWMAISLCFDGHVRNVGSLGLDLFVTFTVAAATELPADTFLTLLLDRWGRRWLACGSMCMSGIFSLLAAVVPMGAPSATLAIMGRFSVNIAYNIGLQYAAELLPTVVRAQGVAFIHIMGYVASILAPFIVLLASIDASLPLIVLGGLGVLGGILSLFLPETLDKELPQTLQDGENFGKGQRLLDFPCCNKRVEDEPTVEPTFRRRNLNRASARASIRGASVRGATYRSSMIQRSIRRRQTADQSTGSV